MGDGIEITTIYDDSEEGGGRSRSESRSRSRGGSRSGNRKRRRRRSKWPLVLLLLGLAGGGAWYGMNRMQSDIQQQAFTEVQALRRDINTYHSFTGTIAPVNYEDVHALLAGYRIAEVRVEEGDEVEAGDVLVVLDTTAISENIEKLDATMAASRTTQSLSIESAAKSYNEYKYNVDNGLDTTLNSAKQSMDNAYQSLVNAQERYNQEVILNNEGISQQTMSSMQQVETTSQSLKTAKIALQRAEEQEYIVGSPSSEKAHFQAVEDAQMQVDAAQISYDNAVANYEAAKRNEQNNLTSLYDTYVAAMTSYLNAVDNYNAAVNASNQRLSDLALSLRQAQNSASDVSNEYTRKGYEGDLEKGIITAPRSGVVTNLNAHVGDMSATATSLMRITDFDELQVEININEYDIRAASEGAGVTVIAEAIEEEYPGQITRISRTADVINGVSYFASVVRFVGTDNTRSGMSAEVRLPIYDLPQVLTLEAAAVQYETDGSAYVWLRDAEGLPYTQKITCGVSDGTYVEVVSGLAEHETVLMPAEGLQLPQRPGQGDRG